MPTPEFLVWSLAQRCRLRDIADWQAPERTERHLRALRAYSDAKAEGRLFEGICVSPPLGFRAEDALLLYGGCSAAENACLGCPANSRESLAPSSLAGCWGMTPLPDDEALVHAAVDSAVSELGLESQLNELFIATSPRWYGFWMQSPLDGVRASLIARILRQAAGAIVNLHPAFADLILGLEAAASHSLPLHVTLYPRGKVNGVWWSLVSHCQVCKAPWSEVKRHQCQTCGYVGHPASPPKRRARGTRPYWPLEQMLGERNAAEFLVRYEAYRRREPIDDTSRHTPSAGQ